MHQWVADGVFGCQRGGRADRGRAQPRRADWLAVYFTHGDKRTGQADGWVSLGKAWLVSRLRGLLQYGRLHLPRTTTAKQLERELLSCEIRMDQASTSKAIMTTWSPRWASPFRTSRARCTSGVFEEQVHVWE